MVQPDIHACEHARAVCDFISFKEHGYWALIFVFCSLIAQSWCFVHEYVCGGRRQHAHRKCLIFSRTLSPWFFFFYKHARAYLRLLQTRVLSSRLSTLLKMIFTKCFLREKPFDFRCNLYVSIKNNHILSKSGIFMTTLSLFHSEFCLNACLLLQSPSSRLEIIVIITKI